MFRATFMWPDNSIVAECEIILGSFNVYIGKAGDCSFTVPIVNSELGDFSNLFTEQEGKLLVYITHDAEVWYCGFLQGITFNGSKQTVDVKCTSLEGYLDKKVCLDNGAYTNQEQFFYAKYIWTRIQQGNQLGVTMPTDVSPVKRDMSWKLTDFRTWSDILNEVANRDNGFEWLIIPGIENGNYTRKLVVGAPTYRIGQYPTVFTFSEAYSNILDYKLNRIVGGTTFIAKGATPENAQEPLFSQIYENKQVLDSGYLSFESVLDRTGVKTQAVLEEYAKLWSQTRAGSRVEVELEVPFDQIDRSILGANVSLNITDYMFPKNDSSVGLNVTLRCIGVEVSSSNTAKLLLDDSEVYASYRKTFSEALVDLQEKMIKK